MARGRKQKPIRTRSPKRRRTAAKIARKTGRKSKATSNPNPLDRLIEAAAASLALPIEPAWKAAVRANLHVIFGQAALFSDFELPDDAEPAPIFKA
jgi:hypothetical protein